MKAYLNGELLLSKEEAEMLSTVLTMAIADSYSQSVQPKRKGDAKYYANVEKAASALNQAKTQSEKLLNHERNHFP